MCSMKTVRIKFTESDKLFILREHYASEASLYSISKKYGIERGSLRYWMIKYPINSESLSLPSQPN